MSRTKQSEAHSLPRALISRSEFQSVTGLSRTTTDRLVASGAIRSLKVGRLRKFRPADVERFLRSVAKRGGIRIQQRRA